MVSRSVVVSAELAAAVSAELRDTLDTLASGGDVVDGVARLRILEAVAVLILDVLDDEGGAQ